MELANYEFLLHKDEQAKVCPECGEEAVVTRMFDIDGTNLVEAEACLACGDGAPENIE